VKTRYETEKKGGNLVAFPGMILKWEMNSLRFKGIPSNINKKFPPTPFF